MTMTAVRPDVYADLPNGLVEDIDQFNKEARSLPMAILLSILVPIFLVVTAIYGIVKVIQTRALVRDYPHLDKPRDHFSDLSRREVKNLAREHDNLRRVLKFAEARTTFLVAALVPAVLAVLIVVLFAVVA